MADIKITPGRGIIALSASSAGTAYITGSATNLIITSSTLISLRSDVGIHMSSSLILTGSTGASPFIVSMPTVGSNATKLQVNVQGVTVFGAPDSAPTAIEGGIYYKDGVFYVGDNT
jgi:hypothetical protein